MAERSSELDDIKRLTEKICENTADLAEGRRTAFSNTDYAALESDRYIAQTGSMSAVRTVTLPAAASVPAGTALTIADESGTVTPARKITIQAAGADTINAGTAVDISIPYGAVTLISDGVDSWQAADSLEQGVPVGNSVSYLLVPGVECSSMSTTAIAAGAIYYAPWFVERAMTISALVAEVTSAGAGGTKLRMGLYTANRNWQPVTLLHGSGEYDADAPGVKTESVSLTLPPGRYLTAIISDGTPTLRALRGGTRYMGFLPTLGATPVAGQNRAVFSYAALPAAGQPWTVVNGSNLTPPLQFVLAAVA